MYGCDCPYCGFNNAFWEVDGCINRYVPVVCEDCEETFYFLQRSWFDPYYDNTDVEVRKESWIKKKLSNKELEIVGNMKDDKGKIVAHIYRPLWDLYEEFGGEEEVLKRLKK